MSIEKIQPVMVGMLIQWAIIPSVQWALELPGIPPKKGLGLTVCFLTQAAPYVLQPFSAFLRKGYDLTME